MLNIKIFTTTTLLIVIFNLDEKRDIIGEVFNNSDFGKKAVAYGQARNNYPSEAPKVSEYIIFY